MTPSISIELNLDTDCYELVATSYSRREPAGPRLFRGGDLPVIQFTHVDQVSAERDCKALQEYCTLAWNGKAPRAKGREEKEEPKVTLMDFKNAVWNC